MKKIRIALVIFLAINTCYAAVDSSDSLKQTREQVAKQYIADLQNADYQDIAQLFDKNGIVISTSRGKVNAKEFFYSFLPNIRSASTTIHQLFINDTDNNRLAVRFFFSYKFKDGEEGQGEYVDEFVFSDNSSKLLVVYMFENLKFENEVA